MLHRLTQIRDFSAVDDIVDSPTPSPSSSNHDLESINTNKDKAESIDDVPTKDMQKNLSSLSLNAPLFNSPNYHLIQPFLQTLTPGSGFPCVAFLLSQYLLQSIRGYDARTRYAFKQLSLLIIQHENQIPASEALSKFEGLEVYLAQKLLEHHAVAKENEIKNGESNDVSTASNTTSPGKKNGKGKPRKNAIIRGLKITSAGVLAGTLFGITGGLAAPGIAAGIAAFAGSAATAATLLSLTSTSAISVLFGIGGGGLAAYKIHRRTKGLTEFTFRKETNETSYLHCVVCMTGWLRDIYDFQRPWGITPKYPTLPEKEKLERFYSKVNPDNVGKCGKIALQWKGEEKELYQVIKEKYGVNPDEIWDDEKVEYGLSGKEEGIVLSLLKGMGVNVVPKSVREIREEAAKKKNPTGPSSFSTKANDNSSKFNLLRNKKTVVNELCEQNTRDESPMLTNSTVQEIREKKISLETSTISTSAITVSTSTPTSKNSLSGNSSTIRSPWSFRHLYSGELYTIRFESLLLLELCDSVTDLAVDLVGTATKEILKQTAIHALISAVALPIAMVNAANMIDGTWTLAIERAEEAGIELAKILSSKKAGCRPVTLVGYSMGARAIYVCLKELARMQEEWAEGLDTREPASIVEDVVLMGMPNHLSLGSWAGIRRIVSGRLVNCYSTKDWILGLMFQYKRISGLGRKVCGTSKVEVPGVESYNVTSFIQSHTDYCSAVEDILKLVQFGLPRDFVNKNNQSTASEDDEDQESILEVDESDDTSSTVASADINSNANTK